jgi:DNA-binding response OmpR family regulator
MARILIVEDEPHIADPVSRYLHAQGHDAQIVGNGIEALTLIAASRFDLVILDLMLPGLDGFDVCKHVRTKSAVPILMLTARDDEIDRVLGLEIGADDYVVKPFSLRELSARVKALLRRAPAEVDEVSEALPPSREIVAHRVLDLHIDPAARAASVDGKLVDLTRREFDLLWVLVHHPGRVLTRDWLMSEVWGRDFDGIDRTVDVHVMRIRDKLGRESDVARAIVALRGIGYRFGSGSF